MIGSTGNKNKVRDIFDNITGYSKRNWTENTGTEKYFVPQWE